MTVLQNNQLQEMYCYHLPNLYNALQANGIDTISKRISYPFMIHIFPEYDKAHIKVFVVGKETDGWGILNTTPANSNGEYSFMGTSPWDNNLAMLNNPIAVGQLVTQITNTYVNFNRQRRARFFHNASMEIFQRLNPASPNDYKSYVWSNLIRVDQDRKRPELFIENIFSTAFPVLVDEIRIAKPDVVVFFGGQQYEQRLKQIFTGIHLQVVPGFAARPMYKMDMLRKIIDSGTLLPPSFYTYDPYFFNWGKEDMLHAIINAIALDFGIQTR